MRDAFRFKYQIPRYMNTEVIYKFKCNICSDVYIGQTKRHFLVREYEHLTEKNVKYTKKALLSLESIVTTIVTTNLCINSSIRIYY